MSRGQVAVTLPFATFLNLYLKHVFNVSPFGRGLATAVFGGAGAVGLVIAVRAVTQLTAKYGLKTLPLVNGGMVIHDISDADRPQEVGFFRPPPAEGEATTQLNDLFIDSDRLCYVGDRVGGGLYIAEYTSPVK